MFHLVNTWRARTVSGFHSVRNISRPRRSSTCDNVYACTTHARRGLCYTSPTYKLTSHRTTTTTTTTDRSSARPYRDNVPLPRSEDHKKPKKESHSPELLLERWVNHCVRAGDAAAAVAAVLTALEGGRAPPASFASKKKKTTKANPQEGKGEEREGAMVDYTSAMASLWVPVQRSVFAWRPFTSALHLCLSPPPSPTTTTETGMVWRPPEHQLALAGQLVAAVRRHLPDHAWQQQERALCLLLQYHCQRGDSASAHQTFHYLHQQKLLKHRSVSVYLRFCCRGGGGGGGGAGGAAAAVTEAYAVFDVGVSLGIEWEEEDFYHFGLLCLRQLQQQQQPEAEVVPTTTIVANAKQKLHYILSIMEAQQRRSVSEAFLRDVLLPWARACAAPAEVVWRSPPPSAPSTDDFNNKNSNTRNGSDCNCPGCGGRLRGFAFTSHHRARLLQELTEKVVPAHCAPRPPPPHRGGARGSGAFQHWQRFLSQTYAWPADDAPCYPRHEQGGRSLPPDLLIDGSNVGYYGLSSWYHVAKADLLQRTTTPQAAPEATPCTLGAAARTEGEEAEGAKEATDFKTHRATKPTHVDVNVDFDLIDTVLQAARSTHHFRRPLVLLQARHTEEANLARAEDRERVRRWRQQGCLYSVPRGVLDDLCWLYAALRLTRPTDTPTPPPTKATMTEPYAERPIYVFTNDLMRDHRFSLLSPRYFGTWREGHTIRFRCHREHARQRTVVHWQFPPPFVACVQCETLAEGAGRRWHIPVRAEDDNNNNNNDNNKSNNNNNKNNNIRSDDGDKEEWAQKQKWLCLLL